MGKSRTRLPVKFNPLGARGIGEIGITGAAAAVANAIYNVHLADVCVDGDVVFAEVLVDGAAVDGVGVGFFVEGHADSPDDAAYELIGARLLVDEGADVVGGDDAADLAVVEDVGLVGGGLLGRCGIGGWTVGKDAF
jgi:hypothetical protein